MDVYRTEEEQVAAIKKWWRDNGMTVAIAVSLAVAVYGGWTWYRHARLEEALTASRVYSNMMTAAEEAGRAPAGSDAALRVQRGAKELAEKYADTAYGPYGALILARDAVNADDYAAAEKYLRDAIDHARDDSLKAVATDRLARVLAAQGKAGDALALLKAEVPAGLVVGRETTRGDILLAQGKRAEARAAFQKAFDATGEKDPARALVRMKLDYVAGE